MNKLAVILSTLMLLTACSGGVSTENNIQKQFSEVVSLLDQTKIEGQPADPMAVLNANKKTLTEALEKINAMKANYPESPIVTSSEFRIAAGQVRERLAEVNRLLR